MTTDETNLTVNPQEHRRSLSWRAMLALVALAIAVASGCAYLLVYPFFHQQPR